MPISVEDRILITGAQGLVGSALRTELESKGFEQLVCPERTTLDLTCQEDTKQFFAENQIDFVFHTAARVGGIGANSKYPAEFIYENLMIESNVIHQAYLSGIKRLIFFGSSCSYPKLANQPISEQELLKGALEPTSEPYSIAKIAGMKLCHAYSSQYALDYRVIVPASIYGGAVSFYNENSHVIPALLTKFHHAKRTSAPSVTIWGSGTPLREFIHLTDLISGVLFVLNVEKERYMKTIEGTWHLNMGSGEELSILKLAEIIKNVTGFEGTIIFDMDKPDGAQRKLLDSSLINNLGWKSKVNIYKGIEMAYQELLSEEKKSPAKLHIK